MARRPCLARHVGCWPDMGLNRWRWIVPDGLWEIARPLLPPPILRVQGGVTQNVADEDVFAAIVYVLTSGCPWRRLPSCFGMSKSTAHRRFRIWSRTGAWDQIHQTVLDSTDVRHLADLTRTLLDAARARADERTNSLAPAPRGRAHPTPNCPSCPLRLSCPSSPAMASTSGSGPGSPCSGAPANC
ncbi:transposase [Streptomyces sp. RLB3-5]|nr:transposase [Streptomyces sp. RLB3-5]QDO61916.1 transposase [Streptomyces sp. RLB1-8]